MKLHAFDIADRLGLHRPRRNTLIKKIVTDSRQVEENTLFAALTGERADGHDYIAGLDKEFKNIMFLTSRKTGAKHDELVCRDVLVALADIAAMYLDTLPARRVAVTGSVGKTTTKEMMSCTLGGMYNVQKSLANRNNELGMPLTAYSVEKEHDVAIFEMGMRGMGQIDYLARRVRPEVGVITNIGVSHIELLGSRENICKAKMELANYIAADGKLILNGDEPLLREAAENVNCKVIWFGLDEQADYFADHIVIDAAGTKYELHHNGAVYSIVLPDSGKHLVYDSLAAFAVAMEMGVPAEIICARLALFKDGGLRQNIFSKSGVTVFDDTYNAAPESMQAALSVLSVQSGRKVAVLADMLELGEHSVTAHREVGQHCKKNGVDVLLAFGQYANEIAAGSEMKDNVYTFANREKALAKLLEITKEGDIILFKGSHSMQCDVLLKEFLERWKSK